MKRIFQLLALVSLPAIAFAQGGNIGSQNSPVVNSLGRPLAGVSVSICQPLATTAASVTSNLAVLTMASNTITAGFVTGMTIQVSTFSGADTYFNGGTFTNGTGITNGFTILSVTSTTIAYPLTHANASASSNGTVLQQGNSTTSCAGLSSIFSDPALTQSISQPLSSDGNGNWNSYATPGLYYAQFYGPAITTTLRQYAVACVPSASTGTCGAPLNGNNAWTGNETHGGTEVFSGGKPWLDPTGPPYNAKCDGSTDDSTALQAAFNAITSAGVNVYIPGICNFSTALTIPTTGLANGSGQYGGILFVGRGPTVSGLRFTGTSGNALSSTVASGSTAWHLAFHDLSLTDDSASFNGNLLFTQNINRVILDNVWVNCLNDVTSTNACAIDIKGQVGVTFTFDEQVNNSYFAGANLILDGIDDSRVSGGQIYPQVGTSGGRTFGIKFNNANIQIDGVHIGTPNSNTAGAVWASTTSAIGARIQNDYFDTDSPGGPHNGTGIFSDGNVSAWLVSANSFNNPGDCVNMSAGVIESAFNGNMFTLCGVGASGAGGFPTISFGTGTCAGNSIIGNTFIGTTSLTSKNAAISESGACSGVYGPNSIIGVGTGYLAKPIAFNASSSTFTVPWSGIPEATSSNLALGGNWGTSPAAPTTTGGDRAGSITVFSGSGSPGANPTIALTFVAGLWPSAPLCLQNRNDNNAPATAVWFVSTTTTSATWTFVGTPAASSTYTLLFNCGFNTP